MVTASFDLNKYKPFNLVQNPMISVSLENCLQNAGYYREKAKWANSIGYFISFEWYMDLALEWIRKAKNIKSLWDEY